MSVSLRVHRKARVNILLHLTNNNYEPEKAKQRFTIALLANAAGEKEPAIVVWKAEEPRCFQGIDTSKLPVQYYSQTNAWMTGEILDNFFN